jgi:hypothetical protein
VCVLVQDDDEQIQIDSDVVTINLNKIKVTQRKINVHIGTVLVIIVSFLLYSCNCCNISSIISIFVVVQIWEKCAHFKVRVMWCHVPLRSPAARRGGVMTWRSREKCRHNVFEGFLQDRSYSEFRIVMDTSRGRSTDHRVCKN